MGFAMMWRTFLLAVLMCVPALVSAQTKLDYFYTEAEKCRLSGDYASAMELYRHCLSIQKESSSVLYNLGVSYLHLREDSIGLSLLQQAAEKESGNPWLYEYLAAIYLERNDVPNSVKTLEHLSSLQTKRSDVLSQLFSLYKSMGNTDAALASLSRIETLEGNSPQLAAQKFSLLMDMERQDEAFSELRKLCEEFPYDQNCKLLMANQYLLVGDSLQAKALFDEVARVEPANMNLQLSLVAYYKAQPDKAYYHFLRDSLLFSESSSVQLQETLLSDYIVEAQSDSSLRQNVLKAFDRILATPQKTANILELKAAYLIKNNAPDEEIAQALQNVLQVEPDDRMAMSMLIQYYASGNDYRAIENLCRQAVNYYPDNLTYHFYLGLSLYQQSRKTEAIDAFNQGVRIKGDNVNPDEVSEMFSILGDLYYEQGRAEDAFAAYDSSLVYKEDNLSCLNNYAYYLSLRNERLDQAEEMSYRTVKKEPANRTYLDTYAWILFKKGDYNGARIYIDRVVSPDSDEDELMNNKDLQGNVIEHAGDIYFMTGDRQTAVWLWNIALMKADDTTTERLPKKIRKKKYIK